MKTDKWPDDYPVVMFRVDGVANLQMANALIGSSFGTYERLLLMFMEEQKINPSEGFFECHLSFKANAKETQAELGVVKTQKDLNAVEQFLQRHPSYREQAKTAKFIGVNLEDLDKEDLLGVCMFMAQQDFANHLNYPAKP